MKKHLFLILTMLVIASFVLVACGGESPVTEEQAEAVKEAVEEAAPAIEEAAEEVAEAVEEAVEEKKEEAAGTEGMKIAFFVSDLSNVFHQAQIAEATKYAMEEYGAEVFALASPTGRL
jgi:uncharacterized protein YpmS